MSVDHINQLILRSVFDSSFLRREWGGTRIVVSRSLNNDLYGGMESLLLKSEKELMKAAVRPDLFFTMSDALLLLLTDNLSSYRLMREQAAYAHHDLFFAKRKNRSYSPKLISGAFSAQNLKDRHAAIHQQFQRHGLLHPALRDKELTAVYMRYVRSTRGSEP